MAPSPKQFSIFFKALQKLMVLVALLVISISSGLPTVSLNTPQARASSSTFAGFFNDCSDENDLTTWVQIRECLNRDDLDEPARTIWQNVIKVPLFSFFDNNALGTAAGLPNSVMERIYGSAVPTASSQSQTIDLYLRENSLVGLDGMGGFEEIGEVFDTMMDGNANDVLCQILDIPPGGPSRNTDDLPGSYRGLAWYGENGDGDVPFCSSRENVLGAGSFGARGLAAAMVYMIADIGSRSDMPPPAEPTDVARARASGINAKMRALKQFIETVNQGNGTIFRASNGTSYVNFRNFYSEHYTEESIFGTRGPIGRLMALCQREVAANPNDTYVTRLGQCYQVHLTDTGGTNGVNMSADGRSFATSILIEATNSLATSVPAADRALLVNFLRNDNYLDLADGYDALAVQKFEYSLEDFLKETIYEGYLEFGAGVFDSSQVQFSSAQAATAPTESAVFITTLNNAVRAPLVRHLKAINERLISQASTYLDRPLPAPPAANPPAAGGSTAQQNTQVFQQSLGNVVRGQSDTRRSALEQLNSYIDRTALASSPKDAAIGLWYALATNDHQPNYVGAIIHTTGDLELLIDERDATGISTWFTDPFLAKLLNACSPNLFSDTINKDNLPSWKACLQHEANFVDGSNTNNEFTLILSRNFSFEVTVSGGATLSMARSPATVQALQSLIGRIDACISNPTCLSLDEEDQATITNREAGHDVDGVDVGNQLLNAILSFINVILALLIKFCFWLAALVMSLFQSVLSYTGFTTSSFVVTMWMAIRDFVNLFFILALLGIAIANIVQYEINNYAIKTILPKLIVIVIAVNFSRLFVGLVIDAANVVEAGVYQVGGMGPHGAGTEARCSQLTASQVAAGGWRISTIPDDVKEGSVLCRLARGLKFEEMQRYSISNNANQPGRQIDFFFANMALFLMVFMLLFGFLALAITFTIRIIVLWALAITSPLYVVSKLSPLTSSIGGQWQSKFFKYATMHVGVAFFMTLAVLAADSVVPQIFSPALQQPGLIAGSQLGPSGFQSLADYLKLIFIVAMIYAGVFTAAKGDYAQGFIDKVAGWGSPSAAFGYAKKGLGLSYGLSQAAGNRLRDIKGPLGAPLRGLGWIMSAPSNTAAGAKTVYESFQKDAKERATRFGLERAHSMSRVLPGTRQEKMRALLTQHREAQVSEIEKLDSLRFSSKQLLRERLDESISSGDVQALLARARILASRGDLNLEQIMKNKKSLRDNLQQLLMSSGTRPEEIDNVLDNLEDANYSAINNKAAKEESRASRTGQTAFNFERLKSLRENQQAAEMVGLLGNVLASGRIADRVRDGKGGWISNGPEGAGLALREMLLAMSEYARDPSEAVNFSEDDFRALNKKVGSSIGIWGVNLKNKGIFDSYLNGDAASGRGGVFQAAQELGLLRQHSSLRDAMQNGSDEERAEIAQIIGSLATEGVYRDAQGAEFKLEESDIGRKLIASNRNTHVAKVGSITLTNGDDDKIGNYVKQMDPAELARAVNASTESAPQMIAKTFASLINNLPAVDATQDRTAGDTFNRTHLNDVLENVAAITTTQAQIDRMNAILEEDFAAALVAANRKYGSINAEGKAELLPEGTAALNMFRDGIVERARQNRQQLEIEKERARQQAQQGGNNNAGNTGGTP